jgi:hypothetical protein
MKVPPVLLALAACLVVAAPAAATTPKQQVANLRSQLALAKKANSRLVDENDKLDGLYLTAKENLAAQKQLVATLRGQVASQAAGGAQAVIAGGPDVMWTSLVTIWSAFPQLPPGTYCGYDKSDSSTLGTGLNFSHLDFELITNC